MEQNQILADLRKQNGYSQEELGDRLGVSRQAVSKWESGQTQPDIQNLKALSELYQVSLDYLVFGKQDKAESESQFCGEAPLCKNCPYRQISETIDSSMEKVVKKVSNLWRKRYTSKTKLFGLPLVDIDLAGGSGNFFAFREKHHAKGIVAIGNSATGVFAVGLCASGVFSLGFVSVGVFAVGLVGIGMAALATISIGLLAFGNIAVGLIATGNIAFSHIMSLGNVALSKGLAFGNAGQGLQGQVIIGDGIANPAQKQQAVLLVGEYLPKALQGPAKFLLRLF